MNRFLATLAAGLLLLCGGGPTLAQYTPPSGGGGSGSGCTVAGSAGQLVYNNGSTGCLSATITTDGTTLSIPTNPTATLGALNLTGTPQSNQPNSAWFLMQPSSGLTAITCSDPASGCTGTPNPSGLAINMPSGATALSIYQAGVAKFYVSSSGNMHPLGGMDLQGSGNIWWDSSSTPAHFNGGLTAPNFPVGGYNQLQLGSNSDNTDTGGGAFVFTTNPANNTQIVVNGTTWTFVNSGATGNQTNLGSTLAATLTQLAADLNASAVSGIKKAGYVSTATTLEVAGVSTANGPFTLANGGTPVSGLTAAPASIAGAGNSFQVFAQILRPMSFAATAHGSANTVVGLPFRIYDAPSIGPIPGGDFYISTFNDSATNTNPGATAVDAVKVQGAVGNQPGATTILGELLTTASATGQSGFNVPQGAAPTSPVNGDLWSTSSGWFGQIAGSGWTFARSDAAQTLAGIQTFSSAPIMSTLTATSVVCDDGSKALTSTCSSATPSFGATTVTTLNKWTFTTPATGITLTGTDNSTYTMPTASVAIQGALGPAPLSGNWFLPLGGIIGAGATIAATGTASFLPVIIPRGVTIRALSVRCTTLAASGNVQFALYANNAATGRPTGTALMSTTSGSTAAAGLINPTTMTPSTAVLAPGLYWFGLAGDTSAGGVAIFATLTSVSPTALTSFIGSTTEANVMPSGPTANLVLTTTVTFDPSAVTTFGNLTGATFLEANNTKTAIPILQVN